MHCRQKMQFAGNDFVVGKKLKKKTVVNQLTNREHQQQYNKLIN